MIPIAALVPIIEGLIEVGTAIFQKVEKMKEIAKQSGELTPEKEAELDQRIEAAKQLAYWKPEATIPAPGFVASEATAAVPPEAPPVVPSSTGAQPS